MKSWSPFEGRVIEEFYFNEYKRRYLFKKEVCKPEICSLSFKTVCKTLLDFAKEGDTSRQTIVNIPFSTNISEKLAGTAEIYQILHLCALSGCFMADESTFGTDLTVVDEVMKGPFSKRACMASSYMMSTILFDDDERQQYGMNIEHIKDNPHLMHSGQWRGYYLYPLTHRDMKDKEMKFSLEFEGNKVEGKGEDSVGTFSFAGNTNEGPDGLELKLEKCYLETKRPQNAGLKWNYHGLWDGVGFSGYWGSSHWGGAWRFYPFLPNEKFVKIVSAFKTLDLEYIFGCLGILTPDLLSCVKKELNVDCIGILLGGHGRNGLNLVKTLNKAHKTAFSCSFGSYFNSLVPPFDRECIEYLMLNNQTLSSFDAEVFRKLDVEQRNDLISLFLKGDHKFLQEIALCSISHGDYVTLARLLKEMTKTKEFQELFYEAGGLERCFYASSEPFQLSAVLDLLQNEWAVKNTPPKKFGVLVVAILFAPQVPRQGEIDQDAWVAVFRKFKELGVAIDPSLNFLPQWIVDVLNEK